MRRGRVANARVVRPAVGPSPDMLDAYIETLTKQQEEILRRADKREYELVSPYYGASGTYLAASEEEAYAQMVVREECGNKVERSAAYRGDFPMRF